MTPIGYNGRVPEERNFKMSKTKITVEDVKIAATVVAKEDRYTGDRVVEVAKEVARQREEVEKQTGK